MSGGRPSEPPRGGQGAGAAGPRTSATGSDAPPRAQPRIYFVLGTVAELIKMMGPIRELRERGIPFKAVLTGQHDLRESELWDVVGRADETVVLYDRKVEKSVFAFGAWALRTALSGWSFLRRELRGRDPRTIVWVAMGDTVSAGIAGVLGAAFRLRVAHVEAGLTSGRALTPFPEELTRRLVSKLSAVLFCPNEWCVSNLPRVSGRTVNTRQNTIADSLKIALAREPSDPLVLAMRGQPYFVFSIHRQENVYNPRVFRFLLERTLEACGERRCLFMAYDLTVARAKELGLWTKLETHPNVRLVPRMPYLQYMHLLKNADFLITDGGSNQEDCYLLGLPCLLLREATERIEGLGENVVLSMNDPEKIAAFVRDARAYARPPARVDESPSRIVVDEILREAGLSQSDLGRG